MNFKEGYIIISITLALTSVGFFGCKEDEIPEFPILTMNTIEVRPNSGALLTGKIENIGKDQIVEVGFIWSESSPGPTEETAIPKEISFPEDLGHVTHFITSLKNGERYYCRLYIKTEENVFYSASKEFVSQGSEPPVIESIVPNEVNFGDTVTIHGKYFGISVEDFVIKANSDSMEILSRSDTAIRAIIPFLSMDNSYFADGDLEIRVSKYGQSSEKYEMEIQAPVITGMSHDNVYTAYEYQIFGRGFHPNATSVSYNSEELQIIEVSPGQITVLSPLTFEELSGTHTIRVGSETSSSGEISVIVPEITSDLSNEEIYSYYAMRFEGSNLDHPELEFYVNTQLIDIEQVSPNFVDLIFPAEMCELSNQITMRLSNGVRNLQKVIDDDVSTKIPEIQNLNQTNSSNYGASFYLDFLYSPATFDRADFYVNGEPVSDLRLTYRDESATFSLPESFDAPNGWCHLTIQTCNATLQYDSIHFIPPPLLNEEALIFETYNSSFVDGVNLNGGDIQVLLDGNEITEASYNSFYENVELWMPVIESGFYDLQLSVNGQLTNAIPVEVRNNWELVFTVNAGMFQDRTSDFPREPIAFISGSELFIGSAFEDSREFYKFDLISRYTTKLNDLPFAGGSFSLDGSTGYMLNEGQFFGYDLTNDSWTSLGDHTETADYPWPMGSFIHDGKFYVFSVGGNYFIYDPLTETWDARNDAPSQGPRGSTNHRVAYDDGVAYIYLYGGVTSAFQLSTGDVLAEYGYPPYYYIGADVSGANGIVYNNEVYFIGDRGFYVFGSDHNGRTIHGPTGGRGSSFSRPVFLEGDYVYTLVNDQVWRYNLANQP